MRPINIHFKIKYNLRCFDVPRFKRQYDVEFSGIVSAAAIHRALLSISGKIFQPWTDGSMLLSTTTALDQCVSSKPVVFQPITKSSEHFQAEFVRIRPSVDEPIKPDGPPLLKHDTAIVLVIAGSVDVIDAFQPSW